MTETNSRFLLVDDDPLNNYLSKRAIRKIFDSAHVDDFTSPEDALEFINSEPDYNPLDGKTTLFLDINMPTMSGWEFLEKFMLLSTSKKDCYTIYMLSSSVDINDRDLANENPLVVGLLEKPLNNATLIKIFG